MPNQFVLTGQYDYSGGSGKRGITNVTQSLIADRTESLEAAPALAVVASQLELDGKRGRIYGPVDLTIEPGTVTLITGRGGSGKTSVLLSLVGRLKPNKGSDLVVLGRELPAKARSVQHLTSAVGIHGLDDLDEEVTVAATIREREAWLARWYKIVHTPDDARIAEVCGPVFGDAPLPGVRQRIHSLDEADNMQLRIALAMMSSPELIVVDDIDALHDTDSRLRVWESLRVLAATGVTVIVAASTPGELRRLGWDTLPAHVVLPSRR